MEDFVLMNKQSISVLGDLISTESESLQSIFSDISNGITITDQHAKIIYVNPAFTVITGYEQNEVLGDNPGILHSGRHSKKFYHDMWADIHRYGKWSGEIWNRRKTGELIPEFLTITKILNSQNQAFYIGIFSDISKLVQENEKKISLALHDPLTGMCNRNLFEERFNILLHEYERSGLDPMMVQDEVAFLFIDLNEFKKLNDIYGHLVGDEVLIFVAQVLVSCSRINDSVGRFGGDEFVVMLSKVKSKLDVEVYCNRVKNSLARGLMVKGNKIIPHLSIGVSFFPAEATAFDILMRYADETMYQAKRTGHLVLFHPDL